MAGRLKGISVVLTAFLVPFTINTALFIWFLTQMDGTGSTDEGFPLFFGQLIFVLGVAVGTCFVVRAVSEHLYKNLPFVAFFPTLVFLCVRLYTCSVHKRSSAICSRLPPENILLAIVFLLISLRVLIQWAVIAAGNERYLERLRSATSPSLYWTYGALLYLLPAVEFFIEVALFPGFKNAKAWFGFVCDLLSGPLAATSVRLAEETLVQLTIAVYLIIFVVYTFVFYHQRYHAFQFGWFVFELVLLFCLLVIEQFLLINPVSLVITVVVFVVWNALKLPPTGYFDADSATIELETFQSFTCLTTKL